MWTRPAEALRTSSDASSCGSFGRNALTSRTTSSYFLPGSTPQSNSTWIVPTPSCDWLSIFFTSSSSLIASSIGSTTSFSTSAGSEPGSTAMIVTFGNGKTGSSERGMLFQLAMPSATAKPKASNVNCQCLTANAQGRIGISSESLGCHAHGLAVRDPGRTFGNDLLAGHQPVAYFGTVTAQLTQLDAAARRVRRIRAVENEHCGMRAVGLEQRFHRHRELRSARRARRELDLRY